MEYTVLNLLEQERDQRQYTIRELERLGYDVFKELNDLDDAEEIVEQYEKVRELLLDEMTSYRKAIIKNERIIKSLNIRIDILKNNDR